MSKAFKCDRCKTCFDPYSIPDNKDFVTIKEFFCQTSENFSNHDFCYRDEEVHLCPDCAYEFGEFMSNRLRKNDNSLNEKGGVYKPRGGIPLDLLAP